MITATRGFIKWACLIIAVCLPLLSTQAHAVTVTVGGTSYELTNSGAYDATTAQAQPWWGNSLTALDFANALGSAGIPWSSNSAVFAYASDGVFVNYAGVYRSNVSSGTTQFYFINNSVTATASASSVPEINAGALSQAMLILFALWLVTRRGSASRVA